MFRTDFAFGFYKTLFVLFFLAFILTSNSYGLDNSSLIGTYIHCQYGTDPNPWTGCMEITADGNGNMTVQGIVNSNNDEISGSATYAVSSDGTLTSSGGDIGQVSEDGSMYVAVDDDDSGGDVEINIGIKKSSGLSNAVLSGAYYLAEYGTDPDPWASLFEVEFDGNGNGTDGSNSFTYSVESDGSLTAADTKGVVSSDGNIFVIIDYDGSDNELSIHIGIKKSSGLSDAVLSGTYAQCEYGTDPDPWASKFDLTFDGNGNVTDGTNTSEFSVNSDGSISEVSGGYEGVVNSEGSVYAIVDVDDSDEDVSIHIGIKKSDEEEPVTAEEETGGGGGGGGGCFIKTLIK